MNRRMNGVTSAVGAAMLCAALAGCESKDDARVDGVLLAQADGIEEPPDGPTLAVDEQTIEAAEVPAGATIVRLAIGRKVLWSQVQALAKKVQAAGAKPIYLVGDRHRVKAMRIEDDWPGGQALQVLAFIDGKACVQPPGAIEAKCVQSGTKDYIDRAYLRELVREQVKYFELTQVEVDLPVTLHWADVVRAIDGARTCCRGTAMLVRLKPPAPAAADPG
jgi:hypothetical protein